MGFKALDVVGTLSRSLKCSLHSPAPAHVGGGSLCHLCSPSKSEVTTRARHSSALKWFSGSWSERQGGGGPSPCLSGCPARPSDSQGQSFCLQGPRRPTRRPPVGGSRKRGRPGLLLKVPSPEPPSHPLNTSWWLDTGRYLSVADCRRRLLGEGRGLEQVRLALGFWRRCTQEAGTCGPVGTAGSFLLSLPCFSPVDTKEETSWWLLPLDFQVSATS